MKTAPIPLLLTLTGCLAAAATFAHEVQSVARTSVNAMTSANPTSSLLRHLDVDADVDRNYHAWPASTSGKTAAVASSTAVGSSVLVLPASCQTVVVRGIVYTQCGSTWYMPQMQGGSVLYVVVTRPR